MSNPAVQLPRLQTCVDNLTFYDASCQYQIIGNSNDALSVVFAMGSTSSIEKLLTEFQKHAQALTAEPAWRYIQDHEPDRYKSHTEATTYTSVMRL